MAEVSRITENGFTSKGRPVQKPEHKLYGVMRALTEYGPVELYGVSSV